MSKPKKNQAASNYYIETIREGAIAANIFRGNTPDGFTYLYFRNQSSSWKSQVRQSKRILGKKFYGRNAEAIGRVAMEAARWIDEHPQAADGPVKETNLAKYAAAA